MNLCSVCGLDFTGVRDFDAHRVGKHAYTYWEGLQQNPPVDDGRRCLSVDEMRAAGWALDVHRRWRQKQRKMSIGVRESLRERR